MINRKKSSSSDCNKLKIKTESVTINLNPQKIKGIKKVESDELLHSLNKTNDVTFFHNLIAKPWEQTIESMITEISKTMKPDYCQDGYMIKSFLERVTSLNKDILKIRNTNNEDIVDRLKIVYYTGYYNLPNPAKDPFQETISKLNIVKTMQDIAFKSIDFDTLEDMGDGMYFDAMTGELHSKDESINNRDYIVEIQKISHIKKILGLELD